jgi:hypothetical protein
MVLGILRILRVPFFAPASAFTIPVAQDATEQRVVELRTAVVSNQFQFHEPVPEKNDLRAAALKHSLKYHRR